MKIYLAMVAFLLSSFVFAESQSQWRKIEPENLMVMSLESGVVVFELAPQFAPEHVSNIRQLVSDGYFDSTAILRSQDNYVVQWGDATEKKTIGKAAPKIKVEFFRKPDEINYVKIESRDAYAEEVGFVDGFPAASDGERIWLTHCYGMLGVSRGMEDDSGNGSGLYVVTGHSPRHLDRNVTLVGRVISGMPLLSSLPRGTGPLGFFESESEYVPINSVRMGAPGDHYVVMDTSSDEFRAHVAKRTTRSEDWFLEPTGRIELCNVGVPNQPKPEE